MEKTLSYAKAYAIKGKYRSSVTHRAERLLCRQEIAQYIDDLVNQQDIHDILSHSAWLRSVLSDLSLARAKENWTAVAALQRLAGQGCGALRESVNVTYEQSLSDEELIRKVSGGDEQVAAMLRRKIGKEDEFRH